MTASATIYEADIKRCDKNDIHSGKPSVREYMHGPLAPVCTIYVRMFRGFALVKDRLNSSSVLDAAQCKNRMRKCGEGGLLQAQAIVCSLADKKSTLLCGKRYRIIS